MRASRLFFTTLRDTPTGADSRGHQMLLRAGYIRQLGAGLFDYLPLGLKVKHRVEHIIRQEINAVGGQEVSLPLVQPAELWQKSGRWDDLYESMVRYRPRRARDMPRHDARGGGCRSRPAGRLELSPAPHAALSVPDEVPG